MRRLRLVSCTFAGLASIAWSSPAAHAAWPADSLLGLPVHAPAAATVERPLVVADGQGGAIVVWQDQRDGGADGFSDLYSHHVLADGSLDPAVPAGGWPVCVAVQDQVEAVAVPDGSGGAILVWQDRRSWLGWDVYAHRMLANGRPDPSWPVNGVAVCVSAWDQVAVRACTDGGGGVIVVWQEDLAGDIRAQHVSVDGVVDPTWPPEGLAVCVAPDRQERPVVVPDLAGGAFAFWTDRRNVTHWDLYGQHVLASGILDPAWPSSGLVVSAAAGDQLSPLAIADGAGAAIVSWVDSRSGPVATDLYVHRVLASGAVDSDWPVDGRLLSAAPEPEILQAMVTNGTGGAIVISGRDPAGQPNYDYDLYAHAVNADGQHDPGWPLNGSALCIWPRQQLYGSAIPMADGGVLVCWFDDRKATYDWDVYAQRLLGDGTVAPGWPQNGRGVSTSQDGQIFPMLASDEEGGAILAWSQYPAPSGSPNPLGIYAQRVGPGGQLGGAVVGVAAGMGSAPQIELAYPNPAPRGVVRLRLALSRSAPATLDLLDVAGRRVVTTALPEGEASREVALDLGKVPAAGVYFVRVRQADVARFARIVVLD